MVQACPLPHQRVAAIRTHHPPRAHDVPTQQHPFRMQAHNWSLPKEANPRSFRSCDHSAVERRPAHADAGAGRETRVHTQIPADEPNSTEGMRILWRNDNPQFLQRFTSIGHQTFAACFIDGRPCTIGHDHVEATLTRSNGRGETGRPSADYENVGFLYHCNNRSSEQKPGPMAAITPSVPGAGRRRFITSSNTTSTDADDKLPVLRRQSQDASSSPFFKPSESCIASSTFGPPVWSTQLPMSPR